MRRFSRRPVRASFVVGIIIVLGLGGLFYVTTERLRANQRLVVQTYEVKTAIERLFSSLTNAESARRGYLLLGDARLFGPYYTAAGDVLKLQAALDRLVADNPHQQKRLAALQPLLNLRLELLQESVDLGQRGFPQSDRQVEITRQGVDLGPQIRGLLDEMTGEEDQLLKARNHATATSYALAVTFLILGSLTSIFLLTWTFARLTRETDYSCSLLEASLDPLVTIARDGKVTDVNHAVENITGIPREKLLGTDFSDYFTEPEKARAGYQQVFREGWVQDYGLEVRHRDGQTTPVLYNASLYRDRTGKVLGVFAAARDISERKRAERALHEERKRFSDVLDMLPAYVVLLTRDYQVPFANRFFRERFGESQGRRCFEYLFGRSEPCEVCETFKVLKTNAPLTWEWTGPDQRHYDIYDFPFTDVDGSSLVLEVGLDVTERDQAEEALRQASRYSRNLLETSLDPLVTIAPDGKITDVNRATEKATGHSRQELVGTDFTDYFTEPEKARAGYQQVFREGSVQDYALEIRHRDGHTTPVLYNASIYHDEKGSVARVFAAARDVTERKRAEEELARHAAALARSNEELAQFAYVASHDLQEPLRKILAFGDRLKTHAGGVLNDGAREDLERIQDSSRRMGRLIESLLELSRVTAKARGFVPVDLNLVIREVLSDLEGRIQETHGRVDAQPLPTLFADPLQMRQLFQNLISNALKFHQENDPPVVHVSCHPAADNSWEIHVKDNGIGFDEQYVDRIFRPFQRLHGRSLFEGTGMGLAICSSIVARHAGRITAHSQPGQGSDFVVTLPARAGAAEGKTA